MSLAKVAKPAAVVIVAAVLPTVLSEYWLYLVTLWFAYAIAVMGLRVLFGICGQLSLAQATFIGIGAYTAGISTEHLHLTAPYEFLLVVAISIVASLIVGFPALRVSGLRLALLTLAFGSLFGWWLTQASGLSGGEQGLYVTPMLFGRIDTTNALNQYFTVAVFAGLCTLIVVRIPHTRIGRAMAAVREAETAARSVGVAVGRTKLVAFVIAGTLAGVSGWLVAHVSGSISPSSFDLFSSVYVLVAVILGGARSTWGAWIGAAYITLVPPTFSSLGHDQLYVFLSGVLLVLCVSLFPKGLVSIGEAVVRRVRRVSGDPEPPPTAPAPEPAAAPQGVGS